MSEGFLAPRASLAAVFGPLERRVLDALWSRDTAASVRDLHPEFPGIAYTTLMTTLDRLFRKGVLVRRKAGRAFLYEPAASRQSLESRLAGSALAMLLPGETDAVRPILSMFIDAVHERDRALLDELEALIRERRAGLAREEDL